MIEKIAAALIEAQQHNPKFTAGQIIDKAASIGLALLKQRASSASDAELLFGLRALIPDPEDGL